MEVNDVAAEEAPGTGIKKQGASCWGSRESDMNKDLDEKRTMEMWTEFDIEMRGWSVTTTRLERTGEEHCVLPHEHEHVQIHGYPTLFTYPPGCLQMAQWFNGREFRCSGIQFTTPCK
jgi:hypothetical protein